MTAWRAATQGLARIDEGNRQATQQEWEQERMHGGITYLDAGSPAATPVVFLHGIGGSARSFLPQLDHFSTAWRAIAWDMPGYGGSTPLEIVSIDTLTAALAGFLQELGLDRPVLVGHSIGGMLVQRLLSLRPHAARAVVLAQTSAAFGSRDPAWAQDFIRTRLAPLDAGQSMADLAAAMVADLAGDLPRIAVPTLVLSGTRDRNAPAPAMERMAARIPGAQYVALDGAGHLAHLEQPAHFDAAVQSFLEGLP